MNNQHTGYKLSSVLFWILWVLVASMAAFLYTSVPARILGQYLFYGIKPTQINFTLIIIFSLALLAQIIILVISLMQQKQQKTAQAYLSLIGGTILIAFLSFTSCVNFFP